jgi:hypothetical protein
LSRSSSPAGSSSWNGRGALSPRTVSDAASTSISPVAISGLALPSGRISTTPVTATQNSARNRWAWASTSGARNTTWAMPDASRRSMKITPPWSRRRATQPANVTCCPASLLLSEPAAWLRSTKLPFTLDD